MAYARFISSVCWCTPGLHHQFIGVRQVYIISLLVYAMFTSSVCWCTPGLHHQFVGVRQVYIISLLVYARFTSSVCWCTPGLHHQFVKHYPTFLASNWQCANEHDRLLKSYMIKCVTFLSFFYFIITQSECW